jgi:hypothetical protein
LSRLKTSLDVYEFTAADEIMAGFQMSRGLPVTRDPCLGLPVPDFRFDAADERAAKQSDLLDLYGRWRTDLHGTDVLAIADAVIIAEQSLTDIDADRRQRKGTARQVLGQALRHFAWLRSPKNAPKDWKFKPG